MARQHLCSSLYFCRTALTIFILIPKVKKEVEILFYNKEDEGKKPDEHTRNCIKHRQELVYNNQHVLRSYMSCSSISHTYSTFNAIYIDSCSLLFLYLTTFTYSGQNSCDLKIYLNKKTSLISSTTV